MDFEWEKSNYKTAQFGILHKTCLQLPIFMCNIYVSIIKPFVWLNVQYAQKLMIIIGLPSEE